MDSHLHEQSEEDMEEYRVILYNGPSNDQFGLTADDDLEEDFRGDLSVEDVEESVRRSLERRSAREEEEREEEEREEEEPGEEEMERATEEIERGGAAPALHNHIEFEPTEVSVYVGELLLRSFLAATFACLPALLFTLRFFIILLVILTQFFAGLFVHYFLLALRFLFLSSAQTLEVPEPLPIAFVADEAENSHEPEMFFEPALFVELEPVLAPTEAAPLGPDILVEEEVDMEWIPYPTLPPTSSGAFTATSSSSSSASTTPGFSTSSSSTPLSSLMSDE